jgi:hypothetical protein
VDLLLEPHEREAHTLDLFVGQRASFHSSDSLPFQQLPQEFDEREHELGKAMLDSLWIHIHAFGQDATKPIDFAAEILELRIHAQSALAKV